MSLASKTCLPCQGGIPALTLAEAKKLLEEVPEWRLSEDGVWIERHFTFFDFAESQVFANRVGDLSEQEGHHPDITFGWGYVKIVVYTHEIRGLHENDFILASKIDLLS